MRRPYKNSYNGIDAVLLGSFFLSGVSALMYQVTWQRSLYGVIGVDIDSVTIIVSVFMLGIGFGGMLGGAIADLAPKRRVQIYSVAEFSIALYGFFSLSILGGMGSWLSGVSGGVLVSCMSFLFLVFPTVLMGMTLPLLTMVFNEWKESIGVSVGKLYFFNTLGAAVGAGLVPFALLPLLSVGAVVQVAAFGNIVVGALALFAFFWKAARN